MKIYWLSLPLLLFFTFCNRQATLTTVGNKHGGCLRTNASEGFKTLIPVAIDENSNYHIASQIYEGLLRFDKDLQVIPAIARSFELSENRKVYTFHLRTEVFFQDDSCFKNGKGRRVTAEDVRYCFERLCTNSEENRQFSVTFKDRVVGAESFFSGQTKRLEGLNIRNDSTLELTLKRQDPNFLNVLCMAGCFIYPPEAVNYYGQRLAQHAVGTGPFYLARLIPGQALTLIRNQNYWGRDEEGKALPYLDSIYWTAVRDRTTELKQFKEASLDLVYSVPASLLQQVFADTGRGTDFEIFSAPALSTHYYGFSFKEDNPQKNTFVRRALNLAVDRQLIVKSILKEEGQPANHGIVPFNYAFATAGYQYAMLQGYPYLPDSARKLLKLAGYGPGKRFPELTLDVNDGNFGRNVLIALKVQKMLKDNLGIVLNLNIVPWQSHTENVEKGNSAFFRYAWVGDYADPETFLSLFYSKNIPQENPGRSYVNVSRFINTRFDSLFEAARLAPELTERMKLLSLAEQIILTEAAVMPLYYDENFRVVRKKFKNLEENAMNYLDFRTTYSAE